MKTYAPKTGAIVKNYERGHLDNDIYQIRSALWNQIIRFLKYSLRQLLPGSVSSLDRCLTIYMGFPSLHSAVNRPLYERFGSALSALCGLIERRQRHLSAPCAHCKNAVQFMQPEEAFAILDNYR